MKATNKVSVGLLALTLWAWPAHPSYGAFDGFLKIDAIPGESTDSAHPNEIVVQGWSWGMTQSGSALPGPGVTNHATFNDLIVTKLADKASPKLMLACASATILPQIELVLRYPGGTNQVEFLKIKLEDVVVSRITSAASSTGSSPLPMEEVSFNYRKIEMIYQAVDQNGAPLGPPVSGVWDQAASQPD
jgi:type VI secretion system secreted protein Hcp